MKRSRAGSTPKQYAYAVRRLNGGGSSKKEIALLSGFSPSVSDNVKHKVEDTEGYQNAIIQLAADSNNLLLGVMAEFKARGLKKFSNADLTKALNAISGAWDRIEKTRAPNKLQTPQGNRLHAVFRQRVETRSVTLIPENSESSASASEPIHVEATVVEKPTVDLDF